MYEYHTLTNEHNKHALKWRKSRGILSTDIILVVNIINELKSQC